MAIRTPGTMEADFAAIDGDAGLPAQGAYQGTRPFSARVRSEVVLSAAPEVIWEVLTSFGDYDSWNTFTPRVDTVLVEGAAVRLEVHGLGRRPLERVEWMHSIVPGRRLCWGMTMGPFLMANRSQWIVPIEADRTLYRTDDVLTGALTPVVMALYGKAMQAGFDAVCAGLEERLGGAGA